MLSSHGIFLPIVMKTKAQGIDSRVPFLSLTGTLKERYNGQEGTLSQGDGYTVFAGRYMKDWPWLEGLKGQFGEKLQLVDLDVSSDESVSAAARFIAGKTDSLDILINNAGIISQEDIRHTIHDELDFEMIQKVYNVNTLGALRMTNALLPLVMTSDTRLIVNISSEAGSITRSYRKSWFAYCMSKAALNMQSSIVHNGIRDQGGQVMVFHPGWMKTYMSGQVNDEAEYPPEKCACDILRIISDREKFKGEQPAYLDHLGNPWPW